MSKREQRITRPLRTPAASINLDEETTEVTPAEVMREMIERSRK